MLLHGSIYSKIQIVHKTIMATCFGLFVKPECNLAFNRAVFESIYIKMKKTAIV